MPVLIWERSDKAATGRVETDWAFTFTPEELREEAEGLDRELDGVLDETLRTVDHLETSAVPREFVRAWAIGSVLLQSGVLEAPGMKNEPRQRLWLALAQKCRTGTRSDGSAEERWQELRPSTAREPRREGGRLDYFELCLWLAGQEFEAAAQTFGGSVRNGWQMLERPALRPLIVRTALHRWLASLDQEERRYAVDPKVFPELMKALRGRWPDRGPGSAKRPIHYEEDQLVEEMGVLLTPVIRQGGRYGG